MKEIFITPEDVALVKKKISALEAKAHTLSVKLAEAAAHGGSFTNGIPEYVAIELELKMNDKKVGRLNDILDGYIEKGFETISKLPINAYSAINTSAGDNEKKIFYIYDQNIREVKPVDKEVQVVSPQSPVGQALLGAGPKQKVEFNTPSGQKIITIGTYRASRPSELTLEQE